MSLSEDDVYRPGQSRTAPSTFLTILTRFNMAIFRDDARLQSREDVVRWSKLRAEIFKAICFPSVVKQTRPPDLWLIGLDAEVPEAAEPILSLIRDIPWIIPAWHRKTGDMYAPMISCFTEGIASRLTNEHVQLITVRLDGDDGIHRKYIKNVELYCGAVLSRFPDLSDFWVTFPLGMKYDGRSCRLYVSTANPFILRVESVERFRSGPSPTAMSSNHAKLFEYGKVFVATTNLPMWVQNIHGGNILNRADDRLAKFASVETEMARFGVKFGGVRQIRRRAFRAASRLIGAVRAIKRFRVERGRKILNG
jgi:hypothetical protein